MSTQPWEYTAYPAIRRHLAGEFADLDDVAVERLVLGVYGPEVATEDVEDFFGSVGRAFGQAGTAVGRFAQQAAPVAQQVLPGVAQGAMTGATIGGPWGALAGAVAGGAGSALSRSGDPRARSVGNLLGGAGQLAGSLAGGGRGGIVGAIPGIAAAMGASGAPAAGQPAATSVPAQQLLSILSRPEVLQSLLSGVMGSAGRPRVMVGAQPVPASALVGLVGNLATRAAGEMAGERDADYLKGPEGEWIADPVDPNQRADALLALLARTPPPWPSGARESGEYAPAYTAEHALSDRLLLESLADEWVHAEEEGYA